MLEYVFLYENCICDNFPKNLQIENQKEVCAEIWKLLQVITSPTL